MTGLLDRFRRPTPRRRSRGSQPALEGLEDRKLLYATLGCQWVYGARITYSFVPDGTSIGGVPSNMFATLNAVTTTSNWQAAIEKAAVIWSSYANINLALVPDNGSPLGVAGNQQNDARFGDIRFSMIPQGTGPLGFTLMPPPYNGGTQAGDIVFNSNVAWKVNSNYDLETVALHEMGHALGLDHTPIANAVMYAYYNSIKQSLTADDIAGIQAVYGAYPTDPVDDGSFATATNITGLIDGNAQIALANQSLAGTSDLDYFVVTVPATTSGTMTVSMQSTNLSSVAPKVIVSRADRTTVGSATLANVYGGTATYSFSGVSPGQVYYIRCSAASPLGSYGAYGLLVNFGSGTQAPIPPPDTTVPQQPDHGGGSLNQGIGTPIGAPIAYNPDSPLQVITVGNFQAYGDVLMASPFLAAMLDPTGLMIPVSPGGPSYLDASVQQVVNAVDAIISAFPPLANAPTLQFSLDRLLSQWGSSTSPSTHKFSLM